MGYRVIRRRAAQASSQTALQFARPDNPQALQRQVGHDGFDDGRFLRPGSRPCRRWQGRRRDRRPPAPPHARDDTVHHRHVPVEQPRLHRGHGRPADIDGGFRTSTRGSRAARWKSASAEMPMPGQMTPARCAPLPPPRSRRTSSRCRSRRRSLGSAFRGPTSRRPRPRSRRDRRRRRGRRVQDRHAGVAPRISGQRPLAERSAISSIVRVSGGTTDRGRSVDGAQIDPAALEQVRDEDTDLVGRALAQGRQPPALRQPVASNSPRPCSCCRRQWPIA